MVTPGEERELAAAVAAMGALPLPVAGTALERALLSAEAVAEHVTPPTCQCRTDRDGDGNGWIKYQARDREFVELRCRDHQGPTSGPAS